MENLGRHPGVEAADGEAQRPIALEDAVSQRSGTDRGAGGFPGGVGELARIDLGDVLAFQRAHLEAAIRDDGDDAGLPRRVLKREAGHLPVFLSPRRRAGEGEAEILAAYRFSGEVQGEDAFAIRGANLVLAARKYKTLCEIRDELKQKYQIQVIAIDCDVSKEEDCKNLIEEAVKTFKCIDILVNNAGIWLILFLRC